MTSREWISGMSRTMRSDFLILCFLLGGLFAVQPTSVTAAGSAMIGSQGSYVVREDDTLLDIAVAQDLGYIELLLANPGVDPWVPKLGQLLVLPQSHLLPDAPRKGIVVNLAELRLYYFPEGDDARVLSYPIGIGRAHYETPTGRTVITKKRMNPSWIPPKSVRNENPELPEIVPPGPENPLGDHALNLGWRQYAIHGTNRIYGVGRRVSHGCIRLYPKDIADLFERVEVGTEVTVVDQVVKIGWVGDALFLEVYPTTLQTDALIETGRLTPYAPPDVAATVLRFAGDKRDLLDWTVIRQVAQERRGIPVRISRAPDS